MSSNKKHEKFLQNGRKAVQYYFPSQIAPAINLKNLFSPSEKIKWKIIIPLTITIKSHPNFIKSSPSIKTNHKDFFLGIKVHNSYLGFP